MPNENLYYNCPTYDKSTGQITYKKMACVVVEHSVTSKITIRLTADYYNGIPNAVIKVAKTSVDDYIDPNKEVEIKQYKE